MVGNITESKNDHPADRAENLTDSLPRHYLRMTPRHFFSNKFDLVIIEEFSKAGGETEELARTNWLNRLMGLNLFLLIVTVGVPVLVYCVLAAGT